MTGCAARMLAEARRNAGLSQSDLADRAGLHRTVVSMYESGAREPRAEIFIRLLTATGAAVGSAAPADRVDCWRNSAVFASLTSVLDAVGLGAPGPLRFPAGVWRPAR